MYGSRNGADGLYSYLNLESTKTTDDFEFKVFKLYSYLNLESTKTCIFW